MARQLTHDQLRIVETLDRPLFVAAGAGSGKSSTLAERVAWALTPGSAGPGAAYLDSLDQALVITFTRLAAAEIREKIRERLRAGGMEAEALSVDAAWISTIHGMCARILRRHAFDLGIDPRFSVLGEARSARLAERAVNECLREVMERGAYPGLFAAFPARGRRAGEPRASVFGMVRALRDAAASAPAGFDSLRFPGAPPQLNGLAARLADEAERALVLGDDAGAFSSRTGAAERGVVEALLERAGELSMRPPTRLSAELAEELARLARPRCNYGPREFRGVLRELQAAYDDARLGAAFARVAPLSGELCALARTVDARYAQLKRDAGALDNDDLLALTLAAFRDRPKVAAAYGERFRLVMVDEFQDTNAQQLRMIELLSGADARHLATVGDAQQSIYRFRAADVQVFRDRAASVGEGAQLRLQTNFRSHADVLALVERALAGGPLPDFMALEAHPGRPDGLRARALPRVDVELVSGARAGRRPVPARDRARACAALVADRIRERLDAGERPGDVALLLGRMSNLDLYLEALRARGVDCVVSGGSTFAQAQEVRLVAALAHALANPKDTQTGLFPVLVSGLFALEADDLCLLATKVQEANGALAKRGIDVGLLGLELPGGTAPSPRLERAHDVLTRALGRVGGWRVEDVLAAVLAESGWVAREERAGADGLSRVANALAAVRHLGELADEGGLGMARAAVEFDEWLAQAKVGPASLCGGADGAVQVMTVHASKGLEFPLVAVAECWGSGREAGVAGVTCEAHGDEVLAALVPADVSAGDLARDEAPEPGADADVVAWARHVVGTARENDEAERARLLYVALTRARESLIVGLSVTVGAQGALSPRLAGEVAEALFGGALPEAGTSTLDYGGSAPARVRHVALAPSADGGVDVAPPELADVLGAAGGGAAGGTGATRAATGDLELLEPRADDAPAAVLAHATPFRAREGTFSYSSVHAQEPAARAGGAAAGAGSRPRDGAAPPALVADDGDADEPARLDDADKATNLGSAFHALAQSMVEAGGDHDPARLDALARLWRLSARQRARLEAAVGRWERSSLRREALSHELVRAELPFFMELPDSPHGRHVEGAIDLLCTDASSPAALVVDYKTGDVGLDAEAVRARHEMQAGFYASVLMRWGLTQVTCAFVCVELDDPDRPGEPLAVRYEFSPEAPPPPVL